MQYASSIDDFVKIMLDGNNGGYANDWLLGDRKTGEIARFENGLKHTNVWRTKDGYFVGSNFPSDPAVTKDETTFDATNLAASANARHVRWDQLMAENKGKIDTTLARSIRIRSLRFVYEEGGREPPHAVRPWRRGDTRRSDEREGTVPAKRRGARQSHG